MSQPMHNTWRMIIATVFMSLLVMAASLAALRAQESRPAEQSTDRSTDEAAADEPEPAAAGEAPDLKMSADSNISFPVDI